jgi:large subunit ribosomal protein L7/L12
MSDITNDDVANFLGNMSVMQVIALTKELEQKWGVKAEPPVVQVQTQQQKPDTQAVAQTEFNVVLTQVPADKKMAVLKMVRELTGLGLKESKEVVEGCPKVIKESVSKEDAESYRAKLVEAGGIVEVK